MSQPAADINKAILDCAKHCLNADDPVACAKEFGADLLNSGNWSLDEIESVTDGALEVIATLTGNRSIMPDKRRMNGE